MSLALFTKIMKYSTIVLAFSLNACQTMTASVEEEKIIPLGQGLLGENLNKLSRFDQKKALFSEYQALDSDLSDITVEWSSLFSRVRGQVVAGPRYRVGKEVCRKYSHFFYYKSQQYHLKGSACRNEDGSWTLLS